MALEQHSSYAPVASTSAWQGAKIAESNVEKEKSDVVMLCANFESSGGSAREGEKWEAGFDPRSRCLHNVGPLCIGIMRPQSYS